MLYRPAEGFPNGKCCIHKLNSKCSNQNSVFISQILQSTHIFFNFSGTCVIECTVYEWWRIRRILTKTKIHIYPLKEWILKLQLEMGLPHLLTFFQSLTLALKQLEPPLPDLPCLERNSGMNPWKTSYPGLQTFFSPCPQTSWKHWNFSEAD